MEKIKDIIRASVDTKSKILEDPSLLSAIAGAADRITSALRNGNRIYFCGNGGSAADAQHLAAELSGRFYTDRPALPAEALHCNTSYLTAVANDYSFEVVYSRIIQGTGRKGDVLVALSTSGNSPNIVQAMLAARDAGMLTVAMTGSTGGKMRDFADVLVNIPSNDTPRIQECHILVGHIICQLVEENLFPGA